MKRAFLLNSVVIATGLMGQLAAQAIDPVTLQSSLARGEQIVILDVRNTALFQKNHIPGAINIPAALVPEKQLPALGKVVVYDDGLALDDSITAVVTNLNQRAGISAEVLEGGYAAWQGQVGQTTKTPGLHPEELNFVSYDQLKRANHSKVVLVDLRKPRVAKTQAEGSPALPPLTDLAKEFPKAQVTKTAFKLPQSQPAASAYKPADPVRVLIDDGDGTAEAMARTLKANGITRVVILAGGETILARHGQSGMQRIGGSQSATSPVIKNTGAN